VISQSLPGCAVAVELLTAHELEAWAAHAATCPACQASQHLLARAVVGGQEDALPCAECQARLPRYVIAQLDGVDVAEIYPQVARHLQDCPTCAELAAEVRSTLALTDEGRLVEPASWPTFDLSFLPPVKEPPVVRDLWRARVSSQVRTWMDEAGRWVAAIQLFVQPPLPKPALAVWETPGDTKTLVAQTVQVGGVDLGIEVTMTRTGPEGDTERGQVRVVVDSPRLPQGPTGTRVTIACEGISQTQVADDLGVVLFEEVPLACLEHMRIEVTLPGQSIQD